MTKRSKMVCAALGGLLALAATWGVLSSSREGPAANEAGAAQAVASGAPRASALGASAAEGSPEAALLVRVKDSKGPAVGARVRVYRDRPGADPRWAAMASAVTAANGEVAVRVYPGQLLVTATGADGARVQRLVRLGATDRVVELELVSPARVWLAALDKASRRPVALASFACERRADKDVESLLGDGPLDERVSGSADAMGALELPLPPGAYRCSASAPGYAEGSEEVLVPTAELVQIAMAPMGTAEGRVVDGSGRGVAGASVSALPGGDDAASAMTGPDGVFSLQVRPGRFDLAARAGSLVGRLPGSVSVAAGETIRDLLIRLDRPAAIRGVVARAGTESGIPGANVSLTFEWEKSRSVVAGPGGEFAFEELLPGTYELSANHPTAVAANVGDIALLAGDERVERIELVSAVAVQGIVLDAEGRPVADALVEARLAESSFASARSMSDERGRYKLEGLQAGLTVVAASTEAAESSVALKLRDGEVADRDLILSPKGILEGRLVSPTGAPIREVGEVYGSRLRRYDDVDTSVVSMDAFSLSGTTGPDGAFRIALGDGTYRVRAELVRGHSQSEGGEVNIRAGETTRQDLMVQRAELLVAGRVIDSRGVPAEGVPVWGQFTDSWHSTGTAVTDGDGKFELPARDSTLPATTLDVEATRSGEQVVVHAVSIGTTDLILQLSSTTGLTGRVEGVEPGALMQVRLYPRDAVWMAEPRALALRQATFVAPRFEFRDLPREPLRVWVMTPAAFGEAEVDLGQAREGELVIQARPVGQIVGRLVTASERVPVAGVSVKMDRDETCDSDKDGRFRFASVWPGAHHLSAYKDVFARIDETVTVASGETKDLGDIDMRGLKPGMIGVTYAEASDGGALILGVAPDGPAERAGIRAGDVIIAVDGFILTRADELPAHAIGTPGTFVVITIRRGALVQSFSVLRVSQ